jgi:transcriptional regulator with XRE-family HTH domain/tetratricopeptide (TPR) repeat protein
MAGQRRQGPGAGRSGPGFDELLVAFRRAAGLTQEELAEASGISVRAIRDMERGRVRAPQRRTVSVLVAAFGLAEDEEAGFLAAAGLGRRSGPPDPVGPRAWPVPRELPAAASDLAGREGELALVGELADRAAAGDRAAPAFVSIHGQPGIGKTTLAVAAGHRFGACFPDGQLFLNLDGTGTRPVDAAEATAGLLRSLGVPDSLRPRSLASQTGLYRTLTRDRRLLVVLDNAVDEAQVRSLIPSGGQCLVLVTSRRSLTGLEPSARIALDVLARDDAVRLLSAIIGDRRLVAEPEAAPELARLCGQLPLALRIAGNRLASRPQWSIRQLVSQLDDEYRRLSALTAGDLGVEAAFAVSYRQLSLLAAAVFRAVALVPGADFGIDLAARVAGVSDIDAVAAVEELVDTGLLLTDRHRYRFHDLVRLFARGCLAREESATHRAAAHGRMVEWLVESTVSAARQFDPDSRMPGQTAAAASQADDERAALAWLDVEATNWMATLRYAARHGRHQDVLAIARSMHWYSDAATHRHPWHEVFALGVEAARALGRRHDEAALLNFLGWALYLCQDRNQDGFAAHQRALTLAREIDDRREEAWALTYCAAILVRTGDPEGAARLGEQATRLFQHLGYALGEHIALAVLGGAHAALGRFDEAMRAHLTFRAFARDPAAGLTATGALIAQASSTMALGTDLAGLGRWPQASNVYAAASSLYRRSGNPFGQASALFRHGLAMRELGDSTAAVVSLRRALALFAGIGSLWWQAQSLYALASTLSTRAPAMSAPDQSEALQMLERAHELCAPLETEDAAALRATIGEALARLRGAPPA